MSRKYVPGPSGVQEYVAKMARLAFVSDLHFDHHSGLLPRFVEELERISPDVLVVAGDAVTGPGRLKAVLKTLTKAVKKVLFLPGNHELWVAPHHRYIDSVRLYEEILPTQCYLAGAGYLGLEPVILGDVAIVGVTGWVEGYPYQDAPDARMTRFPGMESPSEVSRWMSDILERQLKEISDSRIPGVIVVTHTLPFPDRLARFVEDEVVPYLGSESLGRVILECEKLMYVISGHLHIKYEGSVGGARKIPWDINAFGYPEEVGNIEAALEHAIKVIEI